MTQVRHDMVEIGAKTITDLVSKDYIVRDINVVDYEAELSKDKQPVIIPTF